MFHREDYLSQFKTWNINKTYDWLLSKFFNQKDNTDDDNVGDSNNNKKLSYRRDRARCGRNGHSGSLNVVRCCANERGINDFLLALNSNLASIFNRSWDSTPPSYICSRWNWKETTGSRWGWTCFGSFRVPRTLDYPTINLSPRYNAPYNHNARPSQTDRPTDGRTSWQ